MTAPLSSKSNALYSILLPALLAICAGFTIGLTFAPCHSSLCVEQFFPYQARLHIALFYTLLVTITLFLAAQVFSTAAGRLSNTSVAFLPLVSRRVSISGLLIFIWIVMLTFGSIGYWLPAEYDWWDARGAPVGVSAEVRRVAWTGITGHWLDIWIGLTVLPVSRNSILVKVLQLPASALLFFHKVLAYGLVCGALVHGILYYTFVGFIQSAPEVASSEFLVDNPTVSTAEAETKTAYVKLVLPTGIIAFVLMLGVAVTSLPALRKRHYNVFYFTHVISAILILVLTCLHASTNFYFLLPGILLWVGDWTWRLGSLSAKALAVSVENAGNGWYRICLPHDASTSISGMEKGAFHDTGNPWTDSFETYYVNIRSISRIQIHPFTAAITASKGAGPVLLFRQAPERKKSAKSDKEWTRKLGMRVDAELDKPVTLTARVEGPYRPIVQGMHDAEHTLLLVAGSGVTGALSFANHWARRFGSEVSCDKTLRLVWTIRSPEIAEVYEAQQLQSLSSTLINMDFKIHVSSENGRLSCADELHDSYGKYGETGRIWIYASGPEAFVIDAERACYKLKTRSHQSVGRVDGVIGERVSYYIARW